MKYHPVGTRENRSAGRKTKKKKLQVKKKNGQLECEACGFNFHIVYGKLGEDYIECHHTIPISKMLPGATTSLNDLILLCANCHRMVHKNKKKMLSLDELRAVLN